MKMRSMRQLRVVEDPRFDQGYILTFVILAISSSMVSGYRQEIVVMVYKTLVESGVY